LIEKIGNVDLEMFIKSSILEEHVLNKVTRVFNFENGLNKVDEYVFDKNMRTSINPTLLYLQYDISEYSVQEFAKREVLVWKRMTDGKICIRYGDKARLLYQLAKNNNSSNSIATYLKSEELIIGI